MIETAAPPKPLASEDALFREARRLRRRRWRAGAVIAAALLATAALIATLLTSVPASRLRPPGAGPAGTLPQGAAATLHAAGPLAVAPDGALYVTDILPGPVGDTARERILVRLPDGRFRVVAGTGQVGFSGDGGSALRAALANVSDLAVAPDGALYIADGGRVRVVSRQGVIRTIAGDGHGRPTHPIPSGTPALSAPLGTPRTEMRFARPLSIALSPTGQLYISTGWQILRLTNRGRLDAVPARIVAGPWKGRPFDSFGPIAIDDRGDIDVAGVNGWSIWQASPSGAARQIGSARQVGGNFAPLERAPEGGIYTEDGPTILRVAGDRLTPVFDFMPAPHARYFPLTYFAPAPGARIYAEDMPEATTRMEAGPSTEQQLVSLHRGRVVVLWRERARHS